MTVRASFHAPGGPKLVVAKSPVLVNGSSVSSWMVTSRHRVRWLDGAHSDPAVPGSFPRAQWSRRIQGWPSLGSRRRSRPSAEQHGRACSTPHLRRIFLCRCQSGVASANPADERENKWPTAPGRPRGGVQRPYQPVAMSGAISVYAARYFKRPWRNWQKTNCPS